MLRYLKLSDDEIAVLKRKPISAEEAEAMDKINREARWMLVVNRIGELATDQFESLKAASSKIVASELAPDSKAEVEGQIILMPLKRVESWAESWAAADGSLPPETRLMGQNKGWKLYLACWKDHAKATVTPPSGFKIGGKGKVHVSILLGADPSKELVRWTKDKNLRKERSLKKWNEELMSHALKEGVRIKIKK